MSQPPTIDGSTLLASYEHNSRVLEVAGIPIAGWNELTGGGVVREGQNHVFGAGDTPRGLTSGRAVPQDLAMKIELYTWNVVVKPALTALALTQGQLDATAYQRVEWQIVDQYRAKTIGSPSLTITTTVMINAEKPNTPNDGNQFYMELTLKPVGVPVTRTL